MGIGLIATVLWLVTASATLGGNNSAAWQHVPTVQPTPNLTITSIISPHYCLIYSLLCHYYCLLHRPPRPLRWFFPPNVALGVRERRAGRTAAYSP